MESVKVRFIYLLQQFESRRLVWPTYIFISNKYDVPTWHTGAFIAGFSLLDACASVMAGRRVAGHVPALAVLAHVLRRALASVAANVVDAEPTVPAGRRTGITLVDVLFAGLAGEEGCAGADVVGLNGGAQTAVGTRVWGTGVSLLAQFTWGDRGNDVLVQADFSLVLYG